MGRTIRRLYIAVLIIVVVVAGVLVGPQVERPTPDTTLPPVEATPHAVETALVAAEATIQGLKPDNEGRIFWHDRQRRQATPYVLLYLHGFGASWREGAPLNVEFARRYGMNLLAPRLADHGIDSEEPLLHTTADTLYDDAKRALARASVLGERVIVMGTSTGATLALMLAADFPDMVTALLLYSPNIRLADPAAIITARPWGIQITRAVLGGKYYHVVRENNTPMIRRYWNDYYRIEAIGAIQRLLEYGMKPTTFARVHAPIFVGYYYRDDEHQDKTISVPAILRMVDDLATPTDQIMVMPFPDAGSHVITSDLRSSEWHQVRDASFAFADEVLRIPRSPGNGF